MLRYRDKPRRRPDRPIGATEARKPTLSRFDAALTAVFTFLTLALAALLLIAAALAIGRFIAARPAAQVGDVIEIAAGHKLWRTADLVVHARAVAGPWAPPARPCTLSYTQMSAHGGVLTVQAVRGDGVMLNWAGAATAPGVADCGGGNTILVSGSDYAALASTQQNRPLR